MVYVLATIHEPEITVTEIAAGCLLGIHQQSGIKYFTDKDVLLVQGITLSQRQYDVIHQRQKLIVAVNIRTEFLYRILHLDNGRILSGLGVNNSYAVNILFRKINILKYLSTFRTCSKQHHANGNACQNQ